MCALLCIVERSAVCTLISSSAMPARRSTEPVGRCWRINDSRGREKVIFRNVIYDPYRACSIGQLEALLLSVPSPSLRVLSLLTKWGRTSMFVTCGVDGFFLLFFFSRCVEVITHGCWMRANDLYKQTMWSTIKKKEGNLNQLGGVFQHASTIHESMRRMRHFFFSWLSLGNKTRNF